MNGDNDSLDMFIPEIQLLIYVYSLSDAVDILSKISNCIDSEIENVELTARLVHWIMREMGGTLTTDLIMEALCYMCRGGRLGMVKWAVAEFKISAETAISEDYQIFTIICECGYVEMAEWFVEEFVLAEDDLGIIQRTDAFENSCRRGHLDMSKWLAARFKVADLYTSITHVFGRACDHGYLEMAKWLAAEFKITSELLIISGKNCLIEPCHRGYLEVIIWLVEEFALTPEYAKLNSDYAFRVACENGHLEIAKWMADKFKLTSKGSRIARIRCLLEITCSRGHSNVAKWLAREFMLEGTRVYTQWRDRMIV